MMTMFRSTPIDRRLLGVIAVAGLCLSMPAAQAQQSFPSPDDAASALAAAVKSGAKQDMLKVLGTDGEDIIAGVGRFGSDGKHRKLVANIAARSSGCTTIVIASSSPW